MITTKEKTVKRFFWESESIDARSFPLLMHTINATEFLGKPAGYWFCEGVDGNRSKGESAWRLTLYLSLASELTWNVPGLYQEIDWRPLIPESELRVKREGE